MVSGGEGMFGTEAWEEGMEEKLVGTQFMRDK